MPRTIEGVDARGEMSRTLMNNVELPADFGRSNCLAGVTAVAVNILTGRNDGPGLSETDVLESLPIPNFLSYLSLAHMAEVMSYIATKKGVPVYWYQHPVRYKEGIFVGVVKNHLEAGELVHLSVYGDRWHKEVYGEKLNNGLAHAVLVVGFSSYRGEINFDVCDPMTSSSRTLPVKKIFRCVFGSDLGVIGGIIPGWGIPIGVFGKTN